MARSWKSHPHFVVIIGKAPTIKSLYGQTMSDLFSRKHKELANGEILALACPWTGRGMFRVLFSIRGAMSSFSELTGCLVRSVNLQSTRGDPEVMTGHLNTRVSATWPSVSGALAVGFKEQTCSTSGLWGGSNWCLGVSSWVTFRIFTSVALTGSVAKSLPKASTHGLDAYSYAFLHASGASGACVAIRKLYTADNSAVKSSSTSPPVTKEIIKEAFKDVNKNQADDVFSKTWIFDFYIFFCSRYPFPWYVWYQPSIALSMFGGSGMLLWL